MALIALTSNSKLNPSLACISSQHEPSTITLRFQSKLTLSKISISKNLTPKEKKHITLKAQNPIYKYGDNSSNNHNEIKRKRSKSSAIPIPESKSCSIPESETHPNRIWWSNVKVKRPKNVIVGRQHKWNSSDIENLCGMVLMHGVALFAPFALNWGAFWVAIILWFVTGLFGVTLSYHRNLAHKSFKLPKWLEYVFAYCGVLALQRDPIFWVSTHRFHHRYVDTEQDPHSPLEGFWYSQINWLFDNRAIIEKCGELSNVQDLEKQPYYRFIRSTYWLHIILLGVLLYALGEFPYFVWGMGLRGVWMLHMTGFVNSACHLWGKQAWNTADLSKNNWWVALPTFGKGWHSNHHAFEYSARHGLEWWQIDMTWYIVKLLQLAGLATDVKLPTKDHKQQLTCQSKA